MISSFWHGSQHIVQADRYPGACRIAKTGIHQFVGKNYGFAETATAKTCINQPGNFFFLKNLVNQREGEPGRKNFRQQCSSYSRVIAGGLLAALTVSSDFIFPDAHRDSGIQLDNAALISAGHFTDIGKKHSLAASIDLFPRV